MDFNTTIDLIIKDLNDACQIIDDLKNYPGVPEIQVELAKAKCKSAGDVIAMLKKIKQQPESGKQEKKIEPAVSVIPKEVPVHAPDVNDDIFTDLAGENTNTSKASKEKELFEEPEKKSEKKIISPKEEAPAQGSVIFADKFTDVPASINEKLGTRKSEDDVTEIIKSKHIHSLKEAIGINDRFLFVREIFNNDKEAYEQAVAKLESTGSLADAKAVIESYTGNNKETEAVKQLLGLVKRKLSPNE